MSIKYIHSLLPLAVLAFGLALTGCDSNSPEDDVPSIGGMYIGTSTEDGVETTFALDIPATDAGSFTLGDESEASGEVEGVTVSIPLTGTGTYDHPDIAITMTYTVADETFTEQVDGTASASGDILRLEDEDGATLTLTRD
jgi:hypothetical protein